MSGEILTYPIDTSVSADDYLPTEKVVGNRVMRQRTKPEDLKVRPGGEGDEITLAQVAADLDTVEALVAGISAPEIAFIDGVTPGTNAASKAVVAGTDGKVGALTFDGAITQEVIGVTTAGIGAKDGATVSVVENGDPVLHKSVLTLAATPFTISDDAGAGQYSGLKIYDFPAGNITVLGAVIDADITLNETWWTDNIAGDVGLGTTDVTDGNALATTEQNIIATTEVAALTAQVGPINAQSAAVFVSGAAGAADADLYLNIRIDDNAAHMPDAVTNGAFGTDTDWTKGTGWTIAAGVADSDGSQEAASVLSQDISAVEGVTYSVTFTLTRSAGTLTPSLGGTAGTPRSSADTFVEDIVAGADGLIAFSADADFVGTIDNVIVTPLTGSATVSGTVTITWVNAGDF